MKGRSFDECVPYLYHTFHILTNVSAAVTAMRRLMVISTIGTWLG